MLGKQIWRLIRYPSLLVSRILKSKYYPKDSILNCESPKNASWFWQSIISAREAIKGGILKKVGSGKSIRIWKDQWIPNNLNGRPTTRMPASGEEQKVEELISNFRWKRNEIYRRFNREDAENILKIPISLSRSGDMHFWTHCKNGEFSVKSCYQVLLKEDRSMERGAKGEDGSSYDDSNKQIWKTLWSLNIKHKIKLFIWRCITNTLTARETIFRRTKQGSPICSRCGDGMETIEHILFHCHQAQKVWKLAPIQWDGIQNQTGCFKKWWAALSQATSRTEGRQHIALTANLLWQLWKDRNQMEFEGKEREGLKIVQKASSEWMEYEEAWKGKNEKSTSETDGAI
ncbi:unnamed protein product [Coffea canephora]|uniref:Reverse transcriptase zinc-binding domain-containing protein n=1 Tax=Coffea canephora TaxID=49390 RepID=A0A068TVY9_COFCA|nr:unnamed protein product [Coffea canephora]